jgi:hypothetical protein
MSVIKTYRSLTCVLCSAEDQNTHNQYSLLGLKYSPYLHQSPTFTSPSSALARYSHINTPAASINTSNLSGWVNYQHDFFLSILPPQSTLEERHNSSERPKSPTLPSHLYLHQLVVVAVSHHSTSYSTSHLLSGRRRINCDLCTWQVCCLISHRCQSLWKANFHQSWLHI